MHSCQAPGPVAGPGQGPEPGQARYSTLIHIGSKSQIWDKRLSQKCNCL